jgi:pseudaminic acid synthase
MSTEIEIEGRRIGAEHPVYVIAELSANHQHDLHAAIELVHAARAAGADAVKVQTYTADTITIDCEKEHFRIGRGTIWEGRTLYDLYGEASMPWEWQPKLKAVAHELGLAFFSSPFDDSAVEFLEKMGVGAYKIASFELVDLPLIRRAARTGKPLILSTGMATLAEIDESVAVARAAGASQIALLKCTSSYPALPEEMNLRTIPHLAETFDLPSGLSDHSLGSEIAIAAIAVGACILEKHLTLSRAVPGPDAAFSLEPDEFKILTESVRAAEKALGRVSYHVGERESHSRVFRRSLFVVEDVKAGEPFTRENVRSIRPGTGLHTRYLEEVIGRNAARDLERGTPLSLAHVSWNLANERLPN